MRDPNPWAFLKGKRARRPSDGREHKYAPDRPEGARQIGAPGEVTHPVDSTHG